ncbi:hypothetical protein SAMN04488132_101117 [Sediminibacterium ginsengisoli]|uniref:Uncharacterized protein n=1 Tax=Sediminibacterium ginsengisoli TaxID=413434 RepID=A0A1T4JRT5_9BACT|nr:hypothetical protein SAMN04488132_101117 [Sediminibacterium ginsengisoli]
MKNKLKPANRIFEKNENITDQSGLQNIYRVEAVNSYYLFDHRQLLRRKLLDESRLSKKEAMEILNEFEQLT